MAVRESVVLVAVFFFGLVCASSFGQAINFDVPAICAAKQSVEPVAVNSANEKTVEFRIPVSAAIESGSNLRVKEISVEVHWNRDPNLVVDFTPQTELYSEVEGSIAIERRSERSKNVGINLTSGYFDLLSGSANGGLANKFSEKRSYQETPEYGVLVSAGTVRRGTGVKFRFKTSRKSTLEGSRDLVVSYRVPENWRGGIMQVTCRAIGMKTSLGIFGERFDQGTTFVMPVYLQRDRAARLVAEGFSEAEQQLTDAVKLLGVEKPTAAAKFRSLFRKEVFDAEMWVHTLVQSGADARLSQRLPKKLRDLARSFMDARNSLVSLSR